LPGRRADTPLTARAGAADAARTGAADAARTGAADAARTPALARWQIRATFRSPARRAVRTAELAE
jgi:hypothetical protein